MSDRIRGLPIPEECNELNRISLPKYYELLEQENKQLKEINEHIVTRCNEETQKLEKIKILTESFPKQYTPYQELKKILGEQKIKNVNGVEGC